MKHAPSDPLFEVLPGEPEDVEEASAKASDIAAHGLAIVLSEPEAAPPQSIEFDTTEHEEYEDSEAPEITVVHELRTKSLIVAAYEERLKHPNSPTTRRLIAYAQEGDTYAQEKIIGLMLTLVYRLVHDKANSPLQFDERLSVALGVIPGVIDRYDTAANASFATFLKHRITGALVDAERAHFAQRGNKRSAAKKLKVAQQDNTYEATRDALMQQGSWVEHISFDLPIADDEGQSLLDKIGSTDPYIEALEHDDNGTHMQRIEKALEKLTAQEKMVIGLLTQDDPLTQREIGDFLGVTESRISQIRKAASIKIKDELDL